MIQAAARRWLVARQNSPAWSHLVLSQTRIISEDRARQVSQLGMGLVLSHQGTPANIDCF